MSLIVVETEARSASGARNLEKSACTPGHVGEFFDNVSVPRSNLLGPREGLASCALEQLAQERLSWRSGRVAATEAVLAQTIEYVKDRKAFGKRVFDFQNTRFKLAEASTEATLARVFIEKCTELLLEKKLDAMTGAMAKYWTTDKQFEITDLCLRCTAATAT